MKIILKSRVFQFVILCVLIIIITISCLDSFVELPKRPVREYAAMTMALNPDKTETVRLKIPWGYLAPDISYMSEKDQNSFFAKAKAMMLLMGLSDVNPNKGSNIDKAKQAVSSPPKYTTAYSLDALYPTFEAKNEKNIDLFWGKRGVIGKVINISILSISKGHFWDTPKKSMMNSYQVDLSSVERKLSKSKTFKHYNFKFIELPSQHELIRRGLRDKNIERLRADDFIEGAIPKDIWENRTVDNELKSYMRCMRPDQGRLCIHTMYIPEINAKAVLLYHSSLLENWPHIESKTRLLFKEFIELGKEYNNG